MSCQGDCGCKNRSKYTPCGENFICCPSCSSGAACAYAFVTRCPFDDGDGVFMNRVSVMWKEGVNDCDWTERKCKGGASDQIGLGCGDLTAVVDCSFTIDSLGVNLPPSGYALTDDDDCIVQYVQPVAAGVRSGTPSSFYRSTTLQFGCGRIGNSTGIFSWDGPPFGPGGVGKTGFVCGWYDFFQAYQMPDMDGNFTGPFCMFQGLAPGVPNPFCVPGLQNFSCTPDFREAQLNTYTEVTKRLTVTGATTAEIRIYAEESCLIGTGGIINCTMTEVALYKCHNWSCLPPDPSVTAGDFGNNFTMEDYPNLDHPRLPKTLCVVAYSADRHTWCDSQATACACGDAGWNNICLTGDFTCGNFDLSTGLVMYRHFDVLAPTDTGTGSGYDGPLSACGINSAGSCVGDGWTFFVCDVVHCSGDIYSYVSDINAPCGVFFAGPINANCPPGFSPLGKCRRIYFFVWCDGSTWHMRVLCVELKITDNGVIGGVVCEPGGHAAHDYTISIGQVVVLYDQSASVFTIAKDGARFQFPGASAPANPCCVTCGVVTDCCPDHPTNTTLYATFSAPGCLPFLDGIVVTLTHFGVIGSIDFWTGPVTISGCGVCTFYFGVFTGVSCEFVMCIKDGGGSTVWGDCTGGADMGSFGCPFVSAEWTEAIPGCVTISMDCAGLLSVTVTP